MPPMPPAGRRPLVAVAAGRQVARRDDVVDFQHEVRGLGGGGDRLLFRVSRLDDAGLGRVLDFAGEDVQSGLGVAGLVGRAEVDEQVDGVEPGVLGEHAGISSSESANASTASCSRPETVSA